MGRRVERGGEEGGGEVGEEGRREGERGRGRRREGERWEGRPLYNTEAVALPFQSFPLFCQAAGCIIIATDIIFAAVFCPPYASHYGSLQERTPGVGMELEPPSNASPSCDVEEEGKREEVRGRMAQLEAQIEEACVKEDYDLAGILVISVV